MTTLPPAPAHWRSVMVPFSLHDVDCLAEVAYDPRDWRGCDLMVTDCGVLEWVGAPAVNAPFRGNVPGCGPAKSVIGAFLDPYRTWVCRGKSAKPCRDSALLLADIITEAAGEQIASAEADADEQAKHDRQAGRRGE